jgi:hypothetical protein
MIQKPKCACFLPLGEMPVGKGGLHVAGDKKKNKTKSENNLNSSSNLKN